MAELQLTDYGLDRPESGDDVVVPFTLDLATVLVPVVVMVGVGIAGAALAVRRISSVDPLTALGATR